ncbi:MAG: hypothetical protein Q9195_004931 [Heterodermia aff. obscurata]
MGPPSSPSYPLTTTTLSTPQLSRSPHLPALCDLINLAFDHAHRTGHRTTLLTELRLQDPTQLLEELGPNGFCILTFDSSDDNSTEASSEKLIATASAKPYSPSSSTEPAKADSLVSEVNNLFKRTPVLPQLATSALFPEEDGREAGEGLPTWEILAMGVDPALRGRGIAARMLEATIEEIRGRIGGKEEEAWKGEIKILLSTLKELNEGYYQRKGWRTTAERRFEAGVGGSEEGFGVVDMVRVVGGG